MKKLFFRSARRLSKQGFTLAELLVVISTLGIITVFTIPKVIQSQQNTKYNAICKEVAATISVAYQQYQYYNGPSANTTAQQILQAYVSYINIDTSGSLIDTYTPGSGTYACSSGTPCFTLASGAKILTSGCSFGGTNNSNIVIFTVDPDGVGDQVSGGMRFFLHYNGKIEGVADVTAGSGGSAGCAGPYNPTPSLQPVWFSWS